MMLLHEATVGKTEFLTRVPANPYAAISYTLRGQLSALKKQIAYQYHYDITKAGSTHTKPPQIYPEYHCVNCSTSVPNVASKKKMSLCSAELASTRGAPDDFSSFDAATISGTSRDPNTIAAGRDPETSHTGFEPCLSRQDLLHQLNCTPTVCCEDGHAVEHWLLGSSAQRLLLRRTSAVLASWPRTCLSERVGRGNPPSC